MRKILVLALLLALAGCDGAPLLSSPTPTPTCAQLAQPFVKQFQAIAQEWDDAFKLANNTPRSALAAQITSLQAIRRKVQEVEAPSCATLAKQYLIDSMDNAINGLIAFLGQKPDKEVGDLFKLSNDKMAAFGKELTQLIVVPSATATP